MSEDTTQTVVDPTNAPAQQGAAADSARTTDLDAALAEFDSATTTTSTTTSTPEQKPTTTATDPALAERLAVIERERADERFQKAISPVLQKVRGDVPSDVFDDDELIAWMDAKAKRDPRLQNAWSNRDKNPQAWDRVVDGLSRDFAKKFTPRIDERATADREAVAAAVRGASTRAPEGKAPDFAGMSNVEFREAHKKEYGYYPPV